MKSISCICHAIIVQMRNAVINGNPDDFNLLITRLRSLGRESLVLPITIQKYVNELRSNYSSDSEVVFMQACMANSAVILRECNQAIHNPIEAYSAQVSESFGSQDQVQAVARKLLFDD